ncbi:MAG: hypothetical protein F6K24_52830 [Okeania sp. SIO2D1]|nr:hypothetical protein [Okeania sp. SIO2D1]
MHLWLEIIQEISCSNLTIYRLIRSELKAKLKVAIPKINKQLYEEVKKFKTA